MKEFNIIVTDNIGIIDSSKIKGDSKEEIENSIINNLLSKGFIPINWKI